MTGTAAPATVLDRLNSIEQAHVLGFWNELDEDARRALVSQLEELPLEELPGLIKTYVTHHEVEPLAGTIEPAIAVPPASSGSWDSAEARALGERLLKEGKVACFTVAGGQGSRLGYDGPKGCFPVGAVTDKPLFQLFAEQIAAASQRHGTVIPWYVMTSPLNHAATVSFFDANRRFGLPEDAVQFFQQGVMPSMDKANGRLLLSAKGSIATNPDGHGGAFLALWKSGAIEEMRQRGIEQISYFQVDNPHARAVDPVFLGLHAGDTDRSSGQMSSKMVAKAHAGEKVGVFARVGGRTQVLEYSDLPADLSTATDESGELLHRAGSIAIHLMSVDFVEAVNLDERFALPYHRAVKKVPFVDAESGEPVSPDEPNAVKLERFVFDALAMCDRSLVYETDRVEEFAPVKNATGTDSLETSRALQTERAARWLTAAGVEVPRRDDGSVDAVIEISPLTACEASDLQGQDLPSAIEPGARVAL